MIKAMNSKTFDAIKDGVRDSMDTAWKQSKRVSFRTPWVYNKPVAYRSGSWLGIGLFSIAALALGAWLYFRKKKEVADHYTMGEGPGAAWEPEQSRVDDRMATAGQ